MDPARFFDRGCQPLLREIPKGSILFGKLQRHRAPDALRFADPGFLQFVLHFAQHHRGAMQLFGDDLQRQATQRLPFQMIKQGELGSRTERTAALPAWFGETLPEVHKGSRKKCLIAGHDEWNSLWTIRFLVFEGSVEKMKTIGAFKRGLKVSACFSYSPAEPTSQDSSSNARHHGRPNNSAEKNENRLRRNSGRWGTSSDCRRGLTPETVSR